MGRSKGSSERSSMSGVIRWLRSNGDIDALLLRRLKDNRAEQIIHPHWWLGGRFVAVL